MSIGYVTAMDGHDRPLFISFINKGSGGNKKLPPHRLSMVEIVDEFRQAPTQPTPQTSPPWCAVCPTYGVNSMDLPASAHGRPYEGVGRGLCCRVLYKIDKLSV